MFGANEFDIEGTKYKMAQRLNEKSQTPVSTMIMRLGRSIARYLNGKAMAT